MYRCGWPETTTTGTDISSTNDSGSISDGQIAGLAVGGVVLICLVGALLAVLIVRQRHQRKEPGMVEFAKPEDGWPTFGGIFTQPAGNQFQTLTSMPSTHFYPTTSAAMEPETQSPNKIKNFDRGLSNGSYIHIQSRTPLTPPSILNEGAPAVDEEDVMLPTTTASDNQNPVTSNDDGSVHKSDSVEVTE
eukprot:m.1227000 g.1227000  ORF g.1227000 m.1227000 type:complete len:190 (-) comp24641_c2_seq6:3201-3770(-)